MPTKPTPTPRSTRLLEQVYQALGANRVHQRWIRPYTDQRAEVSVEGLSDPVGVITISPITLVPAVLHECIHRVHPEWTELGVERATTVLYRGMDDDACRRLYEAYAAKVLLINRPVDSE